MKIAVVGGGSTYTPELIEGLGALTRRIEVDEVVLTDLDPDRLEVVGGAAERIAAAHGYRGRISRTSDLDRAVEGASAVLIQIRVGGQAARQLDETIPLACGCIGQETTGAGGFAMALRTVPVVLEIAARVRERAASDAWIIDFTNPVGIVTRALLDAGHRAVGLCNVSIGFQRRFAEWLGVAPADVQLGSVGLNHLSWIRSVTVGGVERLPELLEQRGDELADEIELPRRILDTLKAVPSYYLRYYYEHDAIVEELRHGRSRAEEVSEVEAQLLEAYRDPALHDKPELLAKRGGAHYSEAALDLLASLFDDRGDVQVLDVRNAGAIAGVARRCRRGGAGPGRPVGSADPTGGTALAAHGGARGPRRGLREAGGPGGDQRRSRGGSRGALDPPAHRPARAGRGAARHAARRPSGVPAGVQVTALAGPLDGLRSLGAA